MAAKEYYERRSFRTTLKTYLESKGWPTTMRYEEGFQTDETISVPLVAVHFLPTRSAPVQLGNTTEKAYVRIIQVDCYMESEPRAQAINDNIMDFMDEVPIIILNESAAILGSLICQDTASINSEVLTPNLGNPKVTRWRGVSRGTYEAFYN